MAEQAQWVDDWCRVCCTRHDTRQCPGELLATGPERHGWRLLVQTPGGPIVYGTLVAPSGDRWRARILTYPNVLWVLPAGGTLKFLGSSAGGAERKAVEFIKAHCKRCGYVMRKEVPSVESGDVDLEQDEATAESEDVRASQRRKHAVRVCYGEDRPTHDAETDDLSEGGLFIRTRRPLAVGTRLSMRIEIDGFGIPLRGEVRWSQPDDEVGRPRGMGVELIHPHPRYIHYLRQRKKAQESDEPVADADSTALEEWSGPTR